MCGRFTLRTSPQKLLENFGASFPEFTPRFNIAPTQLVFALRAGPEGHGPQAAALRWGLVPSWAKDLKIGAKSINARAETVAEKPMFRSALKRRRCLVLADGYYEWRTNGKAKQPYHFRYPEFQISESIPSASPHSSALHGEVSYFGIEIEIV